MPGQPKTSGKPYLSIVGGTFRQKVDKTTLGAIYREYELPNGKKGEKYELEFKSWNGKILGVTFEDSDYGKMCKIEFDDCIVSLNTEHKYFSSFARNVFNADLSKTITLAPYDFVGDDNKPKTGMNLLQGGEKLKDYFYDGKTSLHGIPEPENKESMDKDDWKTYFIQVKKFLIRELLGLKFPLITSSPEVSQTEPAQPQEPQVERIEINDLPF